MLEKDSVRFKETRRSIDYRNSKEDGYWEPDMTTHRFSGILVCNQGSCKEPVIVCGTTGEEQCFDSEGGESWETYLMPIFFHPPLPIIKIPKSCPQKVRTEICKAFALYWCDLAGCANRVRNALEQILNHFKIKRFELDKIKKRRFRLSLHRRIELFKKNHQDMGKAMLAVKWVGNEGSHPGNLDRDDLLDVFQLIEHLLHRLFVPPEENVALEIAKAINKFKRPRSHRQRTR